jgi:hypothetical protein
MKKPAIPLTLIALLLLASAPVSANPNDAKVAQSYEISWWTVDGGGSTSSSGGGYALGGTIGQSDTGIASGGDYVLSGGFWTWWREYAIFLPLALRGY